MHTHTFKSNKSCVCSRIFFTFPRGLPQKQIDQTNSQPTDSALRLLFYACWVANIHIVTSYLKLFLNPICHGLWKTIRLVQGQHLHKSLRKQGDELFFSKSNQHQNQNIFHLNAQIKEGCMIICLVCCVVYFRTSTLVDNVCLCIKLNAIFSLGFRLFEFLVFFVFKSHHHE